MFAIFASVTAELEIVAAKLPVPVPVTSPVSAMVWFPVFVPLRFVPVTVPVATTDDGVIAPSTSVMAGVVVAVAIVPDMPLAVITDALVTVPRLAV
jgi:hypothetical protein